MTRVTGLEGRALSFPALVFEIKGGLVGGRSKSNAVEDFTFKYYFTTEGNRAFAT